jgi:beta-N-acetylhexosaminidase
LSYIILLSLVFNILCAQEPIDQERISAEEDGLKQQAERIMSRLSLEQKIGQMLMLGFAGTKAEQSAFGLIDKFNAGAFIVFSHNVDNAEQMVTLSRDIQAHSLKMAGMPSFIAIDQEGGKVLRLKNFATVLPGNMNIGATKSTILSFLAGKLTAIDLEMLGINMNLAPVLDVNTSSDNDVIGVRSFGDDPDAVSRLGTAYIRGLQSRRISATAKHFPGHGSTHADSHFGMPVLDRDLVAMRNYDLKPFQSAIKEGVDAIMTAHIAVPDLEEGRKLIPSTLSYKVITELLRKELGYKGLVITDDMEMQAITREQTVGEAAVKAVNAGCDMIIIVWTDKAKQDVYKSLLQAVRTGRIPFSRINESVRRIVLTKLKRNLFDYPDPKIEDVKKIVGNKFHQHIAHIIADKSITLVQKNEDTVPLKKTQKYVVLSPFSFLATELRKYGLDTSFVKTNLSQTAKERYALLERLVRKKNNVDGYIVAVMDNGQAAFASRLKKLSKKTVIVAALDSPYICSYVKNADAYVYAYSFRMQAIRALAGVLSGELSARGELPVKVITEM